MALVIETKGKYKVIRASDDLTAPTTLKSLQKHILNLLYLGQRNFVLDLSGATKLSSAILGILGEIYRKVGTKEASLNVILNNREMVNALDLSGLSRFVRVYSSEPEDLADSEPGREGDGEEAQSDHLQTGTKKGYGWVTALDDLASLEATQEFRRALDDLLSRGMDKIVVDFRKVTTVSSSVLGVIAAVHEHLEKQKGEICVLSEQPNVTQLMDVAGLKEFIRIHASEDAIYEAVGSAEADLGSNTILVVDDMKVVREIMKIRIQELGYGVKTATNGKEAVEIVQAESPDLVMMDIEMPVMNGYEACRAIRERENSRHLPVVFMTGLSDPRERLKALEAGGDDFITKPIQEEDLIFRIKTHLKMRDLSNHLHDMNSRLELMVKDKTSQLMEVERQLYQAEKISAVGTMISGIAHELKNPLFVIGSWAQRIQQKGGLGPDQEKGVGFIEEHAGRCISIVENLLGLVRKRTEGAVMLDVNEIIEQLSSTLKDLVDRKQTTISTELAAKSRIRANATEIEQVLLNLLSNALDAVEDDGEIVLSTRDTGKWCEIRVKDSGCGMEEEVKKKIFDPFYTTKETGKGTGLGLSIVFKIVQQYRGQIKVESQPGKGTTMRVLFPIR